MSSHSLETPRHSLNTRNGAQLSGFPGYYVYIGMGMAVVSSALNGVSFVLQKKGILDVEVKMLREGKEVKQGHVGYLKSVVWWTGTLCMVLAEVTNLVAYSFAPSVLVAPLGSISVFVTALLSTHILHERLSFEAKIGVFLTVLGSVVVVLQSPNSGNPVYTLEMFGDYAKRWWAILYAVLCAGVLVAISVWVGPKWGKENVLIYIAAASIGGSWLVQIAGSVGASVIYSLTHFDTYNVFTSWSLYVCIVVIGVLAVYQVLTTNRALADHGAGIVMPIFFVFFTTATMITFAVLFAGSPSVPGVQVATLVVGFLVISCGVAILYSFNLRALPKRVVELLTGEEEEECEEEDVEMELVKKPEDEEVEITSPSGTLAEVGSSQGILAPVSSAVGLAPPPMPLRGGVSEVSVVSDEPRRRHTSFGGTLHARTVSGGNAANSPVESAGSGTISRGRKVSMSGQSVLGLSRKNTVGYALDVLSSHAWELDENLLKEKYNMGIGTQERGSLKRKVPRVGSSASIDWRDSRALERSGTVGSMVVVEEPDHDDDDLERGDREQSGRDQGGQAGPSDR